MDAPLFEASIKISVLSGRPVCTTYSYLSVSFGYSYSQLLSLPSFAPNPYSIDPASSFLERKGFIYSIHSHPYQSLQISYPVAVAVAIAQYVY